MCIVYETPKLKSISNKLHRCPPTPGKHRNGKGNISHDHPFFFSSSKSILGSSSCITETTFDMDVDSLLGSINELPVTVLLLKPRNKCYDNERQIKPRKLNISDLKHDVPPLPYKITSTEKPMNQPISHLNQSIATEKHVAGATVASMPNAPS